MARLVAVCLALGMLSSVAARAQEKPVTTEAPAEKPVTAEAPAADAQPAQPAEPKLELIPDLRSPLVKEPATPDEIFDAVQLMLDIGRPTLARMYLDKLMEAQLDDETLNRLRDRHGTSAFLRLATTKELKPASVKLLQLSNAASAKLLRDPVRISSLIGKLGGSPAEENEAILQLRNVGVEAVPPLLTLLNDSTKSRLHPTVLRAVVEIGEVGLDPLIAALDSPNPGLRGSAATALGYLRNRKAEPFLWHPALADSSPAVRDAARLALSKILNRKPADLSKLASEPVVLRLLEASRDYLRHRHRWPLADDKTTTLWVWDAQEGTALERRLDPDIADEIMAARFAKLALGLSPARRDVQVLALATTLAAEARQAGPGNALPRGPQTAYDLALTSGREVVDDVVLEAVRDGNAGVALGALDALERIGTKDLLHPGTGLIAALNAADRRVQFAAATAILTIDPREPFPGSSRVVSILHRALENEQRSRAIVGRSDPQQATTLGGYMNELGYDAIVRYTGRDVFREASSRVDVELVVLHANIVRWTVSETVANLRADARTTGIPIVVFGPESLRVKVDPLLRRYPQMFFVAEQTQVGGFASQLKPFLQEISPALTEAELTEQRNAAVSWAAHLAGGHRSKLFPIDGFEASLAKALADEAQADEAQADEALLAIGEIGSAESQRLILEVVTAATAPVERQAAAARRLATHIQRFGLLVPDSGVAEVHRLLAACTDPTLHAALSAVVGSLKPDAALVGERLQGSPGK